MKDRDPRNIKARLTRALEAIEDGDLTFAKSIVETLIWEYADAVAGRVIWK